MNSKNPRGLCDLVKLDGSEELIAKTQAVSVISRSLVYASCVNVLRKRKEKKRKKKKKTMHGKIKKGGMISIFK